MSGQKFSLSFSKKVEKKTLQPSAISNEAPKPQQPLTQALQAVDQDTWKTDVRDAPENQLVIPRLPDTRNAWLRKGGILLETGNDQERSLETSRDGKNSGDGEEKDGETHTDGEKSKEASEQIGKEDANEGQEKQGKANSNEDSKKSLNKGKESKAADNIVKKPLTLDEQAAEALLEVEEGWSNGQAPTPMPNLTIASSSQDNTLSSAVVDVGKEATDDDYDQINIESFGAAVLRGLGWKKTEGVGGMGKRVVEIIDPSVKTLSLARTSQGPGGDGPVGGSKQEGSDLPLVKGAYVFLHSGRHRGTYGVVETVDEDHVLVKAAMTHAVVREVELNLRVVTTAEYKESSRVINKDKYDKYKEAEARKKEELKKKTKTSGSSDDSSQDSRRKRSSETKTKSRYKEPSGDRDKEDTSSRGKTRDGQEETGRELKQRLDSESKMRVDKSREATDSDRSDNRDKMDNIKESRESERIDRRDGEYKSEGRKRDDEPKREHNKYPEKERRKDGDMERRVDREEKDQIESRKNNEPKGESDKNPEERDERFPSEKERKREKYDTQSSRKSGERRERDDERQLDGERREREKREKGSDRERDGEKKDSERQRDADKRNRDGERDRGGEKKEKQRDKYDGRSKERRDPEEERRLSEREKIRMKYESQADGKWGGKRGREDDGYNQASKKFEQMPAMPWVRENLRVRLVSKTYKDGKYHKEKMIVRSVVTAERCECEVESGRTLRDVDPACLETVIPKVHPYMVMIVKGDSKGQLGRILQLHKEQEKASIQLLEDDTVIVKRHYEDICEYVRTQQSG